MPETQKLRKLAGRYPDLDRRQHQPEQETSAERRFRQVVEAAPNAMVMINSAGEIVMVNAQAERVFGYPRAELLGQSVEILVPERFRGHHPGMRATFFADPRPRPMGAGRELYGLKKDGSEFPVEIGLNPIETDEGPMVLSAIVDITERKAAEQALRDSETAAERRFRQVVEAAPKCDGRWSIGRVRSSGQCPDRATIQV